MPYITDQHKKLLAAEDSFGRLRKRLTAGELTYCLQQVLKDYLGKDFRYEDLAVCLGALEGAKADFIDRIVLPYEHNKRKENGDCWD